MSKKICGWCSIERPLNDFYKHLAMADGHLNKCKSCVKGAVKARYAVISLDPSWVDKERERGRNKYRRLEYRGKYKPSKEEKKLIMTRYEGKYPENKKAQSMSGKVPIPIGFTGHHWSYNESYYKDMIFLTWKDHKKAHRFLKYDIELFLYRTLDGDLLDTKTKHQEYILNKINNEKD